VPTEIVNADSIQLYQGVDIGSAKPIPADRARVLHHLIDVVPVGDEITAADFVKRTKEVIESRWSSGIMVFLLVGGSGFYIKTLAEGMWTDGEPDDENRAKLGQLETEELRLRLAARDPHTAARLGRGDRYRIIRALDLLSRRPMGETLTDLTAEAAPDWSWAFAALSMDRESLEGRVRARLTQMLEAGWRSEVEALLKRTSPTWRPLQSIGYKEMVSVIQGQLSEKQFVERVSTRTLQLAKRQRTWFRGHAEWLQFADTELAHGYILERALTGW
jgi:tRNA dimethylallyltransferase